MLLRAVVLSSLLLFAACSQGGKSADAPPAAAGATPAGNKVVGLNGVQGEINGRIVPGSKFSKVQIGMVSREAESIIGPPNDTSAHITGKQFIPFYFGGDGSRVEAFYRGEGQLSYSHPSIGNSTLVLVGITVDPSERGFAH